jgi:peptidoglycan/LPS O-acetylase OafA/YrhL
MPLVKFEGLTKPLLRSRMPELDSLRGIACLMVLIFHGFGNHYSDAGLSSVSARFMSLTKFGWMGVNLFFVLSGFLITGILLDSREEPGYYKRFYMRRVLRILPAYYGVLVLLLLLWQSGIIDRSVSWGFLGLSVVYLSNVTPLFGVPIQYGVLWSLAVEEHFYLLWPACVRRLGLRGIAVLAGVVCLASLAARIVASELGYSPFAYYTWLVADGLAMGALLAIATRFFRQSRKVMWGIAGVAFALAAGCFLVDRIIGRVVAGGSFHVTGIDAFFAGVVTVTLLVGSRFAVRQPVLEFFGEISYGLYLVHILFFDLYDHFRGRFFQNFSSGEGHFGIMVFRFLVVAGCSVGFAYLSRWYYEEPFLRLKNRFSATPRPLEAEPVLPPSAAVQAESA